MQLWLAKNSEVPVRDQLVTQIVLAILSQDLAPGARLPSTRELARRLRIHANTVSAAYRQLETGRWVEMRRGSGVFVHEASGAQAVPPALELDHLIGSLFRAAREKGIPLAALQSRLKLWLDARAPDHFLLIEPDEELRAIVVAEVSGAVPFPVKGAGFDACRKLETLAGAVPIVLPSKFEKVRALLPPDVECIALQARSVPASIAGWMPAPPDALLIVASRWPDFLKLARTLLVAAGLKPEALEFRDARKPRWQRGIESASAVVCDSLTAATVPKSARTIVFPVLADASLARLREFHAFLTRPLAPTK